jgi:hypothetical protein
VFGSGALFEIEDVGFTVFYEWRELTAFQRIRALFLAWQVSEGISIKIGRNVVVCDS